VDPLQRRSLLTRAAFREAVLLAGIVLALVVAWPVLGSLRLLAVGFHEAGHAALAVVTGGHLVDFAVLPNEGGRVLTTGGWPVLILNGGYLGSVAAGIVLLRAARSVQLRLPLLAWILRVIGTFSACYALVDLRDDLLCPGGPAPSSDAALLAEATHVPALVWGLGWMVAGSVAVALALNTELRQSRGRSTWNGRRTVPSAPSQSASIPSKNGSG
jgi:hypothetical protein